MLPYYFADTAIKASRCSESENFISLYANLSLDIVCQFLWNIFLYIDFVLLRWNRKEQEQNYILYTGSHRNRYTISYNCIKFFLPCHEILH